MIHATLGKIYTTSITEKEPISQVENNKTTKQQPPQKPELLKIDKEKTSNSKGFGVKYHRVIHRRGNTHN